MNDFLMIGLVARLFVRPLVRPLVGPSYNLHAIIHETAYAVMLSRYWGNISPYSGGASGHSDLASGHSGDATLDSSLCCMAFDPIHSDWGGLRRFYSVKIEFDSEDPVANFTEVVGMIRHAYSEVLHVANRTMVDLVYWRVCLPTSSRVYFGKRRRSLTG